VSQYFSSIHTTAHFIKYGDKNVIHPTKNMQYAPKYGIIYQSWATGVRDSATIIIIIIIIIIVNAFV